MLQAGGEADLSEETIGTQGIGELGVEDLQRDGPVVPQVAGKVDRGHTPAPELALERVSLPQRFTKCRDRIRHQSLFSEEPPKIRRGYGMGKVCADGSNPSSQLDLALSCPVTGETRTAMTDTSKPTAVPASGETPTRGYQPDAVEAKWQARWVERHTNEPDLDRAERPFYNLMMFP